MARLVVDASVAAGCCFPDEHTDFTNSVLQAIVTTMELVVPTLWGFEIRNTLLMGLERGRITKEAAIQLLAFLDDLNFEMVSPHSYDEVFHLAHAHGLSVYDAAYLDLAPREGLAIASLAKAQIRAAGSLGIRLFEIAAETDLQG